jgi:bifunctional DNA-binding transcriptional regulator/antitoxin component of YhaV-PrlF toxin-antitoxin module
MPKVSAKRQITIPIDQCQALGIEPGDVVESFVVDGQLTLVKKIAGAAKGLLGHVQPQDSMTDEESLQSMMCDRG